MQNHSQLGTANQSFVPLFRPL